MVKDLQSCDSQLTQQSLEPLSCLATAKNFLLLLSYARVLGEREKRFTKCDFQSWKGKLSAKTYDDESSSSSPGFSLEKRNFSSALCPSEIFFHIFFFSSTKKIFPTRIPHLEEQLFGGKLPFRIAFFFSLFGSWRGKVRSTSGNWLEALLLIKLIAM